MPITTRCTCGNSIDGRCHSTIEGCEQLFLTKMDNHYNDQIENMEEKKYPIGGFAPGNYHNRCSTCSRSFFGDKQAVQCESCALASKEKFDALSPEEQFELRKKNAAIANEMFAGKINATPKTYEQGYTEGWDAAMKAYRQPGAVWVKGSPKERKQYFAKVPSALDEDLFYEAVIWPIDDTDHWWCVGEGFKFTTHKDNIIAHLDESGAAPAGITQDAHEKEIMIQAFDKVRQIFEGRKWIMEGRGSYPYNDDRYKEEVRYMYDEFDQVFKATWGNIQSKSFEYRQLIIADYLKSPAAGREDDAVAFAEWAGWDWRRVEGKSMWENQKTLEVLSTSKLHEKYKKETGG